MTFVSPWTLILILFTCTDNKYDIMKYGYRITPIERDIVCVGTEQDSRSVYTDDGD